ncbi:acyl-CoA dehydrogenase family protein [Diaminobutyricimonas sp. LJ205]|uniref:acyl-CoA dehydrogenase family protein n=1 Tax=Diaminobutyricimonas sp. LJ205 TaxID=2683590 RepID=UPI0012F49DED|nr:acyl-CoA dehydrogenase family protein [Diaminobutyricimonas sp. LJ205]
MPEVIKQPVSDQPATNQPPPRVDVDEFGLNRPLVEGVAHFDAAWALGQLRETGRLVGSAVFQHDAELANQVPPVLHTHDRYGTRIDEVQYHPAYHRIIREALAHGAHSAAWTDPRPGANVARAATFMLFAQVEPGHACPVSMTHAAVPVLQNAPAELRDEWMPRALSRDYDATLSLSKTSALFGMAMTEKQGGSDVRANTTSAVDARDGSWLIDGHKWFCSAPMSDAFLVLAQTDQGLGCFLVPRVLPDGARNPFLIQRLKDKLGNHSNASSEVEFQATTGYLIGEEGSGIRTIIEMVARTRLDCVLGSAAGMRQAVAEAIWHVRHRSAFGAHLIDQPVMTAVIADLALESEAATATALRLARAHDADASDDEKAFRRLATAVAKYWVCKRGPGHAYEALECLGGNGYTEAFPLARRYREQPVMAIWEGSGNVIALDVLRALRDRQTTKAFTTEVSLASGAHPLLDALISRVQHMLDDPDVSASPRARLLVELLALALQASLLVRYAPTAVSDAFVGARLGADRAGLYGTLPAGSDLRGILDRH